MGNQSSNESGLKVPTSAFGRRGSLGLSKSELDKRCKPSGLYSSCHWDDKAIRRLIGDGRLAARLKGNEVRESISDQECPICFLQYAEINVTQCCKANLCTECFLQVKPQKEKTSICPFCNHPRMCILIASRLGAEDIEERETKEQKMIEATIKARVKGEEIKAPSATTSEDSGFGTYLQNDATRRARSRSLSEDKEITSRRNDDDDIKLLKQLSLSSVDRQSLEEEMRAQHTHPLALQMQAEAEERRVANELEYHRSNPRRSREAALLRARLMSSGSGSSRNRLAARINADEIRQISAGARSGRRNWVEMMDTFERGGGNSGDMNTLDDMVVLEAALLLSMEEEERNRNRQDESSNGQPSLPLMHPAINLRASNLPDSSEARRRFRGRNRVVSLPPLGSNSLSSFSRGLTEEEQISMAIALSMQEIQERKEKEEEEEEDKTEECDNSEVHQESAPPAVASIPKSPDLACVLPENELNRNLDNNEEEIVFSAQHSPPQSEKLKGKWSPDDSSYRVNLLIEKEEDEKMEVATDVKGDS
mmetsp:Transcript_25062/g.37029  ORF Transcript_25062/g.37029 Transcript_25062/m.37029 type:complete len:537 (+) Transcript_25062:53-1663(+)